VTLHVLPLASPAAGHPYVYRIGDRRFLYVGGHTSTFSCRCYTCDAPHLPPKLLVTTILASSPAAMPCAVCGFAHFLSAAFFTVVFGSLGAIAARVERVASKARFG
jgi:hypothetical protein